MSPIASINRQRAVSDPESEFDCPTELGSAVALTRGEKLAALDRWQFIVGRRVTSAGEGMIEHIEGSLSRDAELLSEIHREIDRLQAKEHAD